MLALITDVLKFLPVVVAVNVCLSSLGGIFDALSKAKGSAAPSPVSTGIAKASGILKSLVDFLSANLPHT